MPLVFTTDCPHCDAENSPMPFQHEVALAAKQGEAPHAFEVIFSCPKCQRLVVVSIHSLSGATKFANGRNGDIKDHCSVGELFFLDSIYPSKERPAAPEFIPAASARCFVQAEDNRRRGHTDSAGAMYRKTVDVATKSLDPSLAGKKLEKRIEALHGKGQLTDSLKDWAHNVRLDGNDATHGEEELTKDELEQLAEFTRYFLIYAFTLPMQVALKRGIEGPSALPVNSAP